MPVRRLVVVCAGMPRSGSTWLYNVVRHLQAAAGEPAYGAWIDDYDAADTSAVHIVKVHSFRPDLATGANVVLTSRRDLRDIAASLLGRNWATPANLIEKLAKMVDDHRRWLERSSFEVIYERMIAAREAEIAMLAEALGLRADRAAVGEVHRQVAGLSHRGDGLYHPDNLLHRNHILDGRSGYHREVVAAELVDQIDARFGPWLVRYGYTPAARADASTPDA